jgi:hypothetical protein
MTREMWLLAGAAVACGGAVGALVLWREFGPAVKAGLDLQKTTSLYARPFEPYVESLRRSGAIVDIDVVEGPMPADAENAAGELDAAWQSLVAAHGRPDDWPAQAVWRAEDRAAVDAAFGADPALAAELRHFLDDARPWYERVTTALDRPHLRWPRTIDPATGLASIAWMPPVQGVVRMLVMRTRGAEDAEHRLAAIRDVARLGQRLDGGDEMYPMLAIAATVSALRETCSNVEQGTVDPRAARAIVEEHLSSPWFPRMTGVLVHRRAEVIDQFRGMRDGRLKRPSDATDWPTPSQLRDPAAASAFVGACEVFGQAIEWVPAGCPEWHRRFLDALEQAGMSRHPLVIGPWVLSVRFCRADAATRLARVALAAAEFRAKHGDFPASLDDLKPLFAAGVPLDPYTDAPFVYERTATGVRVASAGRLADEDALDEATLRERCLVWELKR